MDARAAQQLGVGLAASAITDLAHFGISAGAILVGLLGGLLLLVRRWRTA